jgi:bis(5'-nucleosidyl)-tetraphosphatase
MTISGAKAVGRRSAGAVVFHREADGHAFLLLRAYRNWDFPKGEVGEGEDPLAAARREVDEEAGIADLSFPFGPVFYETPVYARDKVARYYLAESSTRAVELGVNPEIGRPEHHEFRWLRHAEARPLLVARLQAVLDWAEGRLAAAGEP